MEPDGALGEGGLGDVDKKFQLILQKKIIRLAFFGSFFGNEMRITETRYNHL